MKLPGTFSTAGIATGGIPRCGAVIAPGLNAHVHQYLFNFRLDMSVDGEANSVHLVNPVAEPLAADHPHGNASRAEATPLGTEAGAQRVVGPMKGRYWTISSPSVRTALGRPAAHKLRPGENILPFAHPGASIVRRAGFMTGHLWVTPYASEGMYATGPYPNQHPGGAGPPR